ncbi:MAG: hypothetical protein JWO82_3392 [Akkermansiaceae bacterium]|nr:hypothetical protein [Akkermansiaceae bacterium]
MPPALHLHLSSIRHEIEKGFDLSPDDEIVIGHAVSIAEIQDGALGTVTWCLFNAQRFANGKPASEASGAARAWSTTAGVTPAVTLFKTAV